MRTVPIRFKRLAHAGGLPMPSAATAGSAGIDLRAAIDEPIRIGVGQREVIPTGLALALPPGWEGQVRPRSGLAAKHGVTVLNAPGTVDSDYRGEVAVILANHGSEPFAVARGDRIAQLVVAPVAGTVWHEVDDLEATARGTGGFGSTGQA